MLQQYLENALNHGRCFISKGKVASYIPALAKADPEQLGICLMTCDGKCYTAGNVTERFTIQSISKVLSLVIAIQTIGYDAVFEHVRMEPSGDAFNSIVKLDTTSDIPFNPMINSGAIVVASLLVPFYDFSDIIRRIQELCMDPGITLNCEVYESEFTTGFRNRSIGYLLKSKGVIGPKINVDDALDFYFRLCSLDVTAKSLAGFGLLLANDGVHPITGKRLMDPIIVKTVKTLMLTCGMYDGSGEFAVRVGIPSKSGVGGGILSFVNQHAGIGVYGPALDAKGNSIAGIEMLEYLSRTLHLHLFDSEVKL